MKSVSANLSRFSISFFICENIYKNFKSFLGRGNYDLCAQRRNANGEIIFARFTQTGDKDYTRF